MLIYNMTLMFFIIEKISPLMLFRTNIHNISFSNTYYYLLTLNHVEDSSTLYNKLQKVFLIFSNNNEVNYLTVLLNITSIDIYKSLQRQTTNLILDVAHNQKNTKVSIFNIKDSDPNILKTFHDDIIGVIIK